jgi:hypothetical protein
MTVTWMNWRRQYQNLVTGKVSPFYAAACDGLERVTLQPGFDCGKHPDAKWVVDPFVEVRTIHPRRLERVRECKPIKCDKLQPIIDAVKTTLVELWDSTKAHVVFHSSGYDSRILSGCIRELGEARGSSWLGKVLFLSNRWEAAGFYEIMRRQGWRTDQYLAYTEGQPDEHYKLALDFDTFWYKHNAPIPMPGRLWWYLIEWAQGRRILPKDCNEIQAFNGQITQHVLIPGHTLAHHYEYMDWEYYSETEIDSPNGMARLTPLCTTAVVARAWGYVGEQRNRLKQALAAHVAPECAELSNMNLHDHAAPIAPWLLRECQERFDASWYAQKLGLRWKPPQTAAIDHQWALWSLASLCEELHRRGVEIRTLEEV